MIRLFVLSAFLVCAAPALTWAGVDGVYKLDVAHLKKQVELRWKLEVFPKVPPKYKKLIKNRLKQVLASLNKMQTTMWLKKGGKFKGVAYVPKRKAKSISVGTWSQKGRRIVEIKSQDIKTKRKTTMLCIRKGKQLTCQGKGSGMKMLFNKK